jgi:S-formylglutathione hydrolase
MSSAGDSSARPKILIDQGLNDDFLDAQLMPDKFVAACQTVNQRLELRKHEGYDHSYFFISSFIDDHIRHHAEILMG